MDLELTRKRLALRAYKPARIGAVGEYVDVEEDRYSPSQPRQKDGKFGSKHGFAAEQIGYHGLTDVTARAVTDEAAKHGLAVRDVEKEFERRLDTARDMPDPYPVAGATGATAYESGLVWYEQAHQTAVVVGDGDAETGAGMLAALSAQNPWPSNVTAAHCVSDMIKNEKAHGLSHGDPKAAYAHYKKVQHEFGKRAGTKGGCGPVDERAFTQAWRIGHGERYADVLTGRKRRNFANNILGDPESVTIDVHMMKALSTTRGSKLVGKKAAAAFWQQGWDDTKTATKKGRTPKKVSGVGYTVAAQAVINVARRRGLDPRQVQAIVWNTCVNERWAKPAPQEVTP